MPTLTKVAPLIRLLQRGIVAGEDVRELMAALRCGLDVQGVVVATSWGFAPEPHHDGVPAAWQQIYDGDGLASYDPAQPLLRNAPPGSWYSNHIDAPSEYFETPLHEQFVAFWRDVALTQLPAAPGANVTMVLYRERGAKPFDSEDRALMDLLSPHLREGFADLPARAALHAAPDQSFAEVLLGCDGVATVTLPGGEVEWSNGAIELWRRRLGRVPLARFARVVARAATVAEAGGPRRQPLGGGIFAQFVRRELNTRRVVVMLEDWSAKRRTPAAAPAEELLSPRQRQVARMLVAGSDLPSIAAQLGIQVDTARDHRDAIYERLGIGSRIELAMLLSVEG